MRGCTNEAAANFAPRAIVDDGSCRHVGCLDPTALNHNPSAVVAGECVTAVPGCMDTAAANYYAAANVAALGSCIYPGCTDTAAPNYNPSATTSDGSCVPRHPGCTDSRGLNFQPYYNADDGSCVIIGCTDQHRGGALFDPAATFGLECMCTRAGCGGSSTRRAMSTVAAPSCCPVSAASNFESNCANPCVAGGFGCCAFDAYGCMDSRALNFVPAATAQRPEDTCIFPVPGCMIRVGTLNFDSRATANTGCVYAFEGCTDRAASNFVPLANVDDGTCRYDVHGCADEFASNYDSTATINDGSCVATPPPSPPPPLPQPPPAPRRESANPDREESSGPTGIVFALMGVVVSVLALLFACVACRSRKLPATHLQMLRDDGSSFAAHATSRAEYTGKASDGVMMVARDGSKGGYLSSAI